MERSRKRQEENLENPTSQHLVGHLERKESQMFWRQKREHHKLQVNVLSLLAFWCNMENVYGVDSFLDSLSYLSGKSR